MIKIVALYGKAGAGKDTILRAITQSEGCPYHEIVSCTTRPPREGEIDGVNYHFYSVEDFNKLTLLERAEFRQWYYGTALENLDPEKVNIGVFNITGINSLMANEQVEVLPIMIDANDRLRLLRQLYREENPDVKEIVRRFGTDEDDFNKCTFTPAYYCENNSITPVCDLCSDIVRIIEDAFGQNTLTENE